MFACTFYHFFDIHFLVDFHPKNLPFYHFHFFVADEVKNFRSRILTIQKLELMIKSYQ